MKTTFKKTYSHIIYPTNGPQLRSLHDQLLVHQPLMRREIGRPKKLRNKTNDEPKNPHVSPRRLATVICHKCGVMSYNMRSFKGKSADMAIPKG